MGRRGSLSPARERRMASATATTASSWPFTRSCSRASMLSSFCASASNMRSAGMPVHSLTICATSSASTTSSSPSFPAQVSSAAGSFACSSSSFCFRLVASS